MAREAMTAETQRRVPEKGQASFRPSGALFLRLALPGAYAPGYILSPSPGLPEGRQPVVLVLVIVLVLDHLPPGIVLVVVLGSPGLSCGPLGRGKSLCGVSALSRSLAPSHPTRGM